MNMEMIVKIIIVYIVQVGSLWGLLEGYTYFTDDSLKMFLGSFWIALYIVPIITTALYFLSQQKGNNKMKSDKKTEETITTEGDYSPGIVKKNYSVKRKNN